MVPNPTPSGNLRTIAVQVPAVPPGLRLNSKTARTAAGTPGESQSYQAQDTATGHSQGRDAKNDDDRLFQHRTPKHQYPTARRTTHETANCKVSPERLLLLRPSPISAVSPPSSRGMAPEELVAARTRTERASHTTSVCQSRAFLQPYFCCSTRQE